MSRSIVLLGSVVPFLLLAGCELEDGPVSGPPGGTVVVTNYSTNGSEYASASAFFIAWLDTSNGSNVSNYSDSWIPDVRENACEESIFEKGGDPVPVPVGLDVGSTVTLTTDDDSEEIALDASGTTGSYYVSVTPDPGIGKSYSVEIEGTEEVSGESWGDALEMPEQLAIDGFFGTFYLDPNEDTEITWDTVGADAIVVTLQGSTTWVCVLEDDGEFTFPVDLGDELGASGYVTFLSVNESKERLGRRMVRLIGGTGQNGYFYVQTPVP